MRSGGGPLKVFCSYRSADTAAVEAFAARLRETGIDAWLDRWQIRAGDHTVAAMDAGIDGSAAG